MNFVLNVFNIYNYISVEIVEKPRLTTQTAAESICCLTLSSNIHAVSVWDGHLINQLEGRSVERISPHRP